MPSISYPIRQICPIVAGVILALLSCNSLAAEESADTESGVPILPQLLDAERSFQIAKAAAAAGDFQKAIVALERVLLINPDLGNIKYELALLYRNVGALRRSSFYLQEALKDPSMPVTIRQKATVELAQLTERSEQARGKFFGSLNLGVQYDSNALSESDTKQLNQGAEFGGISFAATGDDVLGSDVSGNLTLGGGYRRRIGAEGSALWSSSLQVGVRRYADFTEEDDSTVRLRTGFSLPFAERGQSYEPFVQASRSIDESDDETLTFGVTLRNGGADYLSEITIQGSDADYEYITSAYGSFRFSQSTTFSNQFGFSLSTSNTRKKSESYSYFGASYTASKRFGSLALNIPVVANLTVGASIKDYAEPAPLFDPDNARVDHVTSIALTGVAPVSKNVSLRVGARYSDNRSTIANFKYDNLQISASSTWRF